MKWFNMPIKLINNFSFIFTLESSIRGHSHAGLLKRTEGHGQASFCHLLLRQLTADSLTRLQRVAHCLVTILVAVWRLVKPPSVLLCSLHTKDADRLFILPASRQWPIILSPQTMITATSSQHSSSTRAYQFAAAGSEGTAGCPLPCPHPKLFMMYVSAYATW